MPQQLDLIEHDSHKVTELVSTTNRLIKSFNEANDFISSLAQGKLNIDIPGRNYLASKFKQLHSNLRHLIWQVQQVAIGDYNQNVDFLGDFSEHFNSMIAALKEKKRVEKALRESEEKYGSLFRNSNDGIFIHDLEGNIIDVNPKVLDQFGYSKSEMLSIKIPLLHPLEALNKSKCAFETITRYGSVNFEIDFIKKNGAVFTAEVSSSLFNIGEKQVVMGIVRDITDRKQAELELQQAKKMEAIGTLAGGVAHDLNNILSGLVSYPDMILMDLPEDSPLRKPILTMKKSGEKSAVIVQDLLTLARRGVSISEVVNLNDTISEQLKSPEFEKLKSFHPGVQVELCFEKDLLNIRGSNTHLSKSVMNLVSNAAEAMPGGGKIRISTENRSIDRPVGGYEHVQEGDYVAVTVSDTGIGISKEDMANIFEPFYTRKVMGRSGTGLGMAVVWGTVNDHKGYIEVESSMGKGTTFTLYFPVTREEIFTDKLLLSFEDYMGSGESILVVDDVEEQREIASDMLNKLHYSVNTVSSGENAVEYFKYNSADLLVLDMIMDPGIDGLETYKRILKIQPNQKAIIVSGYTETDQVKETLRLGAGQYIKKPYTLQKMGLAVKKELKN